MRKVQGIQICEIFGPTIQGEGALIGLPTIFVRTGGCDYRCRWCDTLYAVENEFQDQWQEMSALEILGRIKMLSGNRPLLVSLSGGNPALQPLDDLLALGKDCGYGFALETQGTVARPWFASLDFLTLSPKPPSSGMKTDWQKLVACVAAAGTAAVSLKLVVLDEEDYLFAKQIAAQLPQLPVYLQPCNLHSPVDKEGAHIETLQWLVAKVLADAWYEARVLPQLHVLLWGNQRGR